jgi:hypothetical protein
VTRLPTLGLTPPRSVISTAAPAALTGAGARVDSASVTGINWRPPADIEFAPKLSARIRQGAEAFEAVCTAASRHLSDREHKHLRFATSVKLLEMAGYRPYEVDLSDCVFLKRVSRSPAPACEGKTGDSFLECISGTAARLAAKGRWTEARTLMLPGATLPFWIRLILRTLIAQTFTGEFVI